MTLATPQSRVSPEHRLRELMEAERLRPHDLHLAREAVELEGSVALRSSLFGSLLSFNGASCGGIVMMLLSPLRRRAFRRRLDPEVLAFLLRSRRRVYQPYRGNRFALSAGLLLLVAALILLGLTKSGWPLVLTVPGFGGVCYYCAIEGKRLKDEV